MPEGGLRRRRRFDVFFQPRKGDAPPVEIVGNGWELKIPESQRKSPIVTHFEEKESGDLKRSWGMCNFSVEEPLPAGRRPNQDDVLTTCGGILLPRGLIVYEL